MIRCLSHATEAMAKRGLKLQWVVATIESPDWTEPDVRAGRIRAYKRIDELEGRILRVVYFSEFPDIVVLTAYPDRDALKRRKLP